jgi:hypothetical protein
MRRVGSRRERRIAVSASGNLLAEGARFNEAVAQLSKSTFVPKGIYRFRSHEAANRHAEDCLVRGMGLLAAMRDVADRIVIERAIEAFRSNTADDD